MSPNLMTASPAVSSQSFHARNQHERSTELLGGSVFGASTRALADAGVSPRVQGANPTSVSSTVSVGGPWITVCGISVCPCNVGRLEQFAHAMSTTCEFRSVAEHEVDVEQIRIGRTRNDEIAGVREKGVRVVVVEGRAR